MLLETGFLQNDIADRTKTLSDLWTYARAMGDALVFLVKEVEQIKPMAEQIKKFEKQQQEVLSIKEQIDSRIKQRAEQIRNEIQQEKEKVNQDLPGVA